MMLKINEYVLIPSVWFVGVYGIVSLERLVSSLISSVLVKCFMCNLVYGLSMCAGR